MTLFETRGLEVTYRSGDGPVPAVRGVDLTVGAGETLGIAGESGCGKSTVVGSVLRLLPRGTRVSGQVLLDGEDVLTMNPGRLRAVRWSHTSIVFQGAMNSLNPVRTVARQVAEPILLHEKVSPRSARERAGELLEQVGISPSRMDQYPHQFSGGQKQRIMIAMALACRPKLILADEPTTALDVMVQAQVLQLITGLVRDAGVGLILITHDLSVLARTCDRAAIMYAGRIVEHGPTPDVFGAPRHPYTKALAGAFPTIGDGASRFAPRGLGGDPPHPDAIPPGCPFHPRCAVVREDCASTEMLLWPAGPAAQPHSREPHSREPHSQGPHSHEAACVHVRDAVAHAATADAEPQDPVVEVEA